MSNCTPGMTPAAIKYLLVLDDLCREGKGVRSVEIAARMNVSKPCLLYTSDAADD